MNNTDFKKVCKAQSNSDLSCSDDSYQSVLKMFPDNGANLTNMKQVEINNRFNEVKNDPVLWE